MRIETDRLILREFTMDDLQDVFEYQQLPEYMELYPWINRNEDDVKSLLNMFMDWRNQLPRGRFQLAITLRGDDKVIGSCGIRRTDESELEADIGYELAPAHWGQGIATEAASAIVRFGFGHLDLHRISSWCIAENVRSVRVLEKLGMKLEGRLRENEHYRGRYWDTLVFGMLRSEWQQPNTVFDLHDYSP